MTKTVYLGGPISGLSYQDATLWRRAAASYLELAGVLAIDPMRNKEYLAKYVSMPHSSGEIFSRADFIYTRDRSDIFSADLLLVNTLTRNELGAGTLIEMGWANALDIPIVLVVEPGSVWDKPFVRGVAGVVVHTLVDGLSVVTAMLGAE